MRKSTIVFFFILSVIMGIVGAGLIIAGIVGSTFSNPTKYGFPGGHIVSFGNLPLFIAGVIVASLSGIPYLVAWIGALINTARSQQWIWFALLFIFHWLALLIYLIAVPGTPRSYQQYPQYMPHADLPPQPPQNYPRS